MTFDFTIFNRGTFVGRIWRADVRGPAIVHIRNGAVYDISSEQTPTMSGLIERDDLLSFIKRVEGDRLCSLEELLLNPHEDADETKHYILAPCDLQAIKACGVTFAQSMLERVIEEKATGNPVEAARIRELVSPIIGNSLHNVKAGSQEAQQIKATLIKENMWSQYLEVGIGPDAEVFTKAQPLSSVGYGSKVGLHPISQWNNPEPEMVLAIDSKGRAKGATLGNDVNLRDVEGRSALLLGKAKDNNASTSIGPFIRLFDETYSMDDVREADVFLHIEGTDGFTLDEHSSMKEISRDPIDLVNQTIGKHHQYPDGLMLFMGTLFAPTKDRDVEGEGFTHKYGDIVTIFNDKLGTLVNSVDSATQCPPWKMGISFMLKNLSQRHLL